MNPTRLYPILVISAATALLGFALLGRRGKKTSEQLERARRVRLTLTGRISDANVIDVVEADEPASGHQSVFLIYKYDVAGVTYEASQDITHLRQFVDLYSCRLGMPASVKYDPHNPGDSILISETWSGLRKPAIRQRQGVVPDPGIMV